MLHTYEMIGFNPYIAYNVYRLILPCLVLNIYFKATFQHHNHQVNPALRRSLYGGNSHG